MRLMNEQAPPAVSVIQTARDERAAHERIVLKGGVALSPAQRLAGDRVFGAPPKHVSLSAMASGQCVGLLSAEVHQSRRLPGSTVVIARRVAASMKPDVVFALLEKLDHLSIGELHARRIVISFAGSTRAELDRAAELVSRVGFEPCARPTVPGHTILLDMRDGEEGLLRQARPSLRRALRDAARLPVHCCPIDRVSHVDRMHAIKEVSYTRHGAVPPTLPLAGFIEAAGEHPDVFNLVGLYDSRGTDAGSLLAFEFASFDGRLATTEHAGMMHTRVNGRIVPGGYATLWESIRWAIRRGAVAFDMGGISVPGDSTYEATRTIGDFKRHFGGEIVPGLECQFEKQPDTFNARVMNSLERLVNRFR